jgi:hypothetical protein
MFNSVDSRTPEFPFNMLTPQMLLCYADVCMVGCRSVETNPRRVTVEVVDASDSVTFACFK